MGDSGNSGISGFENEKLKYFFSSFPVGNNNQKNKIFFYFLFSTWQGPDGMPNGVLDRGPNGGLNGVPDGVQTGARGVARRGARRGQTKCLTGAMSSATSFLNAMSLV
jgi:hypothetical protein